MSEEHAAPVARNERDKPFRIRVSLQRYFSDERTRCYMMVNGASSVRWLEARLRQEFALPGAICLLSAGYLLPRGETLGILRPDDPVEVIPVPAIEDAQNDGGNEPDRCLVAAPMPPPASPLPPAVATSAVADGALLLRRNLSLTDTNGDGDGDGDDDEVDALQQSKRRALSLLDRLEAGSPRRRRRRVHCRRRRLSPVAAPAPAPPLAPVVRSGSSRSPRRVVPLQEAPPAPAPAPH